MISEFLLSLTEQDGNILVMLFTLYIAYKSIFCDYYKSRENLRKLEKICEQLDKLDVDYDDLDFYDISTYKLLSNRYLAAYFTDLIAILFSQLKQGYLSNMIQLERQNIIDRYTYLDELDAADIMLRINKHFADVSTTYNRVLDDIYANYGKKVFPENFFDVDYVITDTSLFGIFERIINTYFEDNYQKVLVNMKERTVERLSRPPCSWQICNGTCPLGECTAVKKNNDLPQCCRLSCQGKSCCQDEFTRCDGCKPNENEDVEEKTKEVTRTDVEYGVDSDRFLDSMFANDKTKEETRILCDNCRESQEMLESLFANGEITHTEVRHPDTPRPNTPRPNTPRPPVVPCIRRMSSVEHMDIPDIPVTRVNTPVEVYNNADALH